MVGTVDIPLGFETIDEAWLWVSRNITYQPKDYWPHPEEVYRTRTADCQGYSVLLGYFLAKMGYTPYIIVYDPVWDTSNALHAVVYVEELDKYLEPQWFGYYETVTKRTQVLSMDEAIYIGRK